jgi:HPt (histidine-containing phosphotransfer) domain-containing protein
MILYGKSGNFIGIGKEELSFLGFEDMDEFKNEYKDFADLFVNKPGYIFNFKNFSWIDYTLHSGAPKKSVILNLKNGQEIETNLKISELFLINPNGKENIYYCVEISNSSFKANLQNASMASAPSTSPRAVFDEEAQEVVYAQEPMQIETTEYVSQEPVVKFAEEPTVINEPISFDIVEDFSEPAGDSEFKLKFDQDILETDEKPAMNLDFEMEQDFSPSVSLPPSDDALKLKIDLDELKPMEIPDVLEEETIDFDIVSCADELGLDLGEIAQIIEDFIEKVDKNIPILREELEANESESVKDIALKLKGIADTLQMKQFSQHLNNIIKAEDRNKKKSSLEIFVKLVEQLKKELI